MQFHRENFPTVDVPTFYSFIKPSLIYPVKVPYESILVWNLFVDLLAFAYVHLLNVLVHMPSLMFACMHASLCVRCVTVAECDRLFFIIGFGFV